MDLTVVREVMVVLGSVGEHATVSIEWIHVVFPTLHTTMLEVSTSYDSHDDGASGRCSQHRGGRDVLYLSMGVQHGMTAWYDEVCPSTPHLPCMVMPCQVIR